MTITIPTEADRTATSPTAEGVIDSLLEPVALIDAGARILHANAAFAAVVGLTRADLAGRPLAEVSATPPDDLATYLRRCAGTLQPIPGGLDLRLGDGTAARHRCDGAAVRGGDGPSGAVLLRFRPHREAVSGFAVLTEKIRELSREILRRQRSEEQLRRASEHQRLLINELNHRVKNTLATVQSIATQTLRHSPSPDLFRQAFTSRLMALSQAHNLLTETQWNGTELRKLIELEMAPYETAGDGRARLSGPPVRIGPKAAVAFGLAFHELATNAAKYGALSTPQGWVEVTWSIEGQADEHRLTVRWNEHDGPPVAPPTRRGFGSRVIEQGLAYDLEGMVRLEFAPDGVRCAIDVPHRTLERDGHD